MVAARERVSTRRMRGGVMRLIDLAVVYVVLGVVCVVTIARRRSRPSGVGAVDFVLVLFVWPLYVPALLGNDRTDASNPGRAATARIHEEHQRLSSALERVDDPVLVR